MLDRFVATAVANPSMKAYYLADGVENLAVGYLVRATVIFKPQSIQRLEFYDGNINTVAATLTPLHIGSFFNFLAVKGYTENTYRQVKALPAWRSAYGVAQRHFEMNHKVHGLMHPLEDATYCRICRTLLPLRMLSIDHQKAKSGGETAAILRVFRGLGLTRCAPRGAKNLAAVAAEAASVGGNPNPPLGVRPDRYTLSEAGAIYYTIFREGGLLGLLGETCLHHYLNLRPACGPCNSRLRNSNIF